MKPLKKWKREECSRRGGSGRMRMETGWQAAMCCSNLERYCVPIVKQII
jgi:hypothetical protein